MGAWAVLEGDYGDYSECASSYMCGRRQCNYGVDEGLSEAVSSITYHIHFR